MDEEEEHEQLKGSVYRKLGDAHFEHLRGQRASDAGRNRTAKSHYDRAQREYDGAIAEVAGAAGPMGTPGDIRFDEQDLRERGDVIGADYDESWAKGRKAHDFKNS